MKFNLFPQQPRFFQVFDEQAELIVQICRTFETLVTGWEDVPGAVARIVDLEHQGDELFHELMHSLNHTFVTPIDREDIQRLGSIMDDVLDLIEGAATRMQLFQVGRPSSSLGEMAQIVVKCAAILKDGMKRLPGNQDLTDLRKPLHELETLGDGVNRRAVADLFASCKEVADVVNLIKWKEIIDLVEDAIDKFVDIFDVLESVVVKHA